MAAATTAAIMVGITGGTTAAIIMAGMGDGERDWA
jgi:hypothetical protein